MNVSKLTLPGDGVLTVDAPLVVSGTNAPVLRMWLDRLYDDLTAGQIIGDNDSWTGPDDLDPALGAINDAHEQTRQQVAQQSGAYTSMELTAMVPDEHGPMIEQALREVAERFGIPAWVLGEYLPGRTVYHGCTVHTAHKPDPNNPNHTLYLRVVQKPKQG